MKTTAIIAAVIAAAIGAIAWGALGALTGYEIGILAWGLGALVGIAVRVAGGGGPADAVAAAILAMLAIFAGKALAIEWGLAGFAMEDAAEFLPPELYREYQADAAAWQQVDASDPEAVDAFMVSHGYTEAASAADVSFEERQGFREARAPLLLAMHEEQWSEDEWRENMVTITTGEILASYSWFDRIKDSLGLFDIIFIFLGVSTAFKIALEPGDDTGEREARAPLHAQQPGAGASPPPGGLSPARPPGSASASSGTPPPGGLSPPRAPSGSSGTG